MTITDVTDWIIKQSTDEDAESIREALALRRTTLEAQKMVSLRKDDIVVFNELASPKYLKGVKAKVVSKKRSRVTIVLEENAGRFHAGVEISCPLSIIDKEQ